MLPNVVTPSFSNILERGRDESWRRIYARRIPHTYTH